VSDHYNDDAETTQIAGCCNWLATNLCAIAWFKRSGDLMTQTIAPVAVSDQLIDAFCRRWDIVELALFGSALRTDFSADSDVDVLATFAPHVVYTLSHLTYMEDELTALFGRRVDLVDRRAVEESPNYIRRRSILEGARVIYASG
jgi:predicted nucleotidyltransferase